MIPIPEDVAGFLGRPVDDPATIALAAEHLPVVTAMVRAYVRGRGFTAGEQGDEPADDLALVIIASTARLTANPEMLALETTGPFTRRQGVFEGWTLPELAILHTYRRRAA